MSKSYQLIVLLVSLFLVSCGKSNKLSEGNSTKISIKYSQLDSLTNGDFIIIDGIKFEHINKSNKWLDPNVFPVDGEDSNFEFIGYLPTSKSYRSSEMHGREFMERIDAFSIARTLAKKLKAMNYQIEDAKSLSLAGKLTFSRSDSTKINIKVPIDYPAFVETID